MVRQDGDKYLDAITGQPVTVKADTLESLTPNNSLRTIVDSASSGLLLQSPDIAVRTQAINTLLDQPENASREGVEAARKTEADAALRARLDVIWASTVLAQGADATRDARLEAIRILGADSNPQSRQKLMPFVEKDAAGKYKEADEGVRVAAQQAIDQLRSDERRAEVFGNVFAGEVLLGMMSFLVPFLSVAL